MWQKTLYTLCTLAVVGTVPTELRAGDIEVDGRFISTGSGVEFPDGTLQTTAATASEPRTPIGSVPFTISESGSYFLTGNVNMTTSGNAITVDADNVTLDLMGFTIGSSGAGTHGILISGQQNVEIRNGTIRNFSQRGIYENLSSGTQHRVLNLRVQDNGDDGIFLFGSSHLVSGCTVSGNAGTGVSVGAGSAVSGCLAFDNDSTGITADKGSTVSGNTVYNNGGTGIFADGGSTIIGNTAYQNGSVGIIGGDGATIIDNSVLLNQSDGIRAAGPSLVLRNTASQNNQENDTGAAGIRVGSSSYLKNNVVDSNNITNILVLGGKNAIEENLITNADVGILFFGEVNLYVGNRFSGNTVNVDLSGLSETDGGGNISF